MSRSATMRTLLLAGTVAIAGPALAQPAGSPATRDYVEAAAHSDMFETMEAQSALAESKDDKVRAFARRMIQDHGRTGRALRDAAAHAGLPPPVPAIGADQAPLLAALQSDRGRDFDRTYWRQQALAHRAALVTAQGYAANGDDPAVRQAARAAVPIISAHLAMAEQMARANGS